MFFVYGCRNNSDRPEDTVGAVTTKIRDYLLSHGFTGSIPAFNDAEERTFEEVRELVLALDI